MVILININIVGKSTVNEEIRLFLESQLNGRDERWEETERKRKERRVRKSQVRRRWRKRDERGIQQQHFFCASSPSSAASSLAASKYSLLASHRIGQHLSLSRPVFLSLSLRLSLASYGLTSRTPKNPRQPDSVRCSPHRPNPRFGCPSACQLSGGSNTHQIPWMISKPTMMSTSITRQGNNHRHNKPV